MDVTTWLSKAHAEFRRLRSGELADNLRAQGISYRIIWGLESYRLKEIAQIFLADETLTIEGRRLLANALWDEDVRESKMLATRLYPTGEMSELLANEWASAIQYTELADQACMNLFARLPFAATLANAWARDEASAMKQYAAMQLALRLDLTELRETASAIAQNTANPLWLRHAASRVEQN